MYHMMTKPHFRLHPADYAVCFVTTAIALGIGIYHALSGRGQTSTVKYLLGDRTMAVFPVSLSFVVTYMSSISLLGSPAESYVYGLPGLFIYFSVVLSNILAAWITVPLLHPLRLTSSYEYLLMRYKSKVLQKIGSFLGIIKNVIYLGVVLYGPAIALDAVAEFPIWASILIIALSSAVYTSLGGFKAVIWTDVLQMTIMVFGLLAIVIKSTTDMGSAQKLWDYNVKGKRIRMLEFNPDPTIRTSFWTAFAAGSIYWLAISFDQQAVQRISSMQTQKQAQKVLLLSVPGFYVLAILNALEGFAAYAFYSHKRCDPFEEGVISGANEIMPYFVMELFAHLPGFPGIFLAALFSAALSTASSCLNSLSAVTLNDFIQPIWPSLRETKATLVAKLLVFVYGLISVGVCFLIMMIGGPITQISGTLIGCVGGPICGLFLLGAFFPWANVKGAIAGVVIGLSIPFWIAMGASSIKIPWLPPAPTDKCNLTEMANGTSHIWNQTQVEDFIIWTDTPYNGTGLAKMYSMSYHLNALEGITLTMVVGLVVSFITGANKLEEVDPKYISNIVRSLYYGHVKSTLEDKRNCEEMEVFVPTVTQYTN